MGPQNLKRVKCRNHAPFRDGWLGLATVNMYTKYEVSMFTHYEYMKCVEKCKNKVVWAVMGHQRSPETSPFDRAHMTFYSTFRRKWSILTHPTCICRHRRVIPFEFRHDLWRQKTKVMALSCGVICVILSLAVFIQYRSVTDT